MEIKSDIPAFQMHPKLYFVGSDRVSVHIVETAKGLVMIDTGYPDMLEQILDSMADVGLDAKDICAIFHSHGHIDHFGGTCRLKALSGATTYISRIDNAISNGTLDLSWAKELNVPGFDRFDADVLVEDGDVFDFGDTTIRCRLTPGHTAGVLSFFVTLPDGIVAAMHGGVGMNTLDADWLNRYGLSLDCREVFRAGLHDLRKEKVDIVMGNHAYQNDTKGKRSKVLADESIIDPAEWSRFLDKTENNLNQLLVREEEKKHG